jgi:ribosome-associated toxin RatA of RatAB toxin-antitoxin module
MVAFMETQRIKLTPPSIEYSESMFTVIEDSKEEFAPFLPWVTDSLTLADIEENTKTALVNFEQFVDEFWFNIIENATGQFIGAIALLSGITVSLISRSDIGYAPRRQEKATSQKLLGWWSNTHFRFVVRGDWK